MTAIGKFILALITKLSYTGFRFRINREKLFSLESQFSEKSISPSEGRIDFILSRKFSKQNLSRQLKITETSFYAQNYHNRQVYIGILALITEFKALGELPF